jgi:hypothetical protein
VASSRTKAAAVDDLLAAIFLWSYPPWPVLFIGLPACCTRRLILFFSRSPRHVNVVNLLRIGPTWPAQIQPHRLIRERATARLWMIISGVPFKVYRVDIVCSIRTVYNLFNFIHVIWQSHHKHWLHIY